MPVKSDKTSRRGITRKYNNYCQKSNCLLKQTELKTNIY